MFSQIHTRVITNETTSILPCRGGGGGLLHSLPPRDIAFLGGLNGFPHRYAPAEFAAHFATEEGRLIAKVAEGGSWALWMGVFNKAWLQLLKSYGMNHSACMMLTRDICPAAPLPNFA
jgi:hypothetical protein